MGVEATTHVGTSAGRTMPAWQIALAVGFVAALVAAPSIRNGFVADDQWVVANRHVLEHPSSVGAVLKEPYWPQSFGGVMWRPAVIASWAVDYHISTNPHWFHAVNVFWAALVAALFALLACDLAGPLVGLITGLLFAVHPVHVEAIANVVGRAELMSAAGYAIALLCAVRSTAQRAYLLGVAAGATLAIASKEIAVTLPAAVVLAYAARREDVRQSWRAVVAATLPIVAYFIVHGFVGIRTFYAGGLAVGLEHLDFFERSWAMVRLSLEWWRLFLFPAHLSADYSPGELTVSTGFTVWHVLGAAIWVGVSVLAWRMRRTIPGIAIGLAWMVITISPVANVAFPTEFLIAERTLYLPSFGIVFALACAIAMIRSRRARYAALAVVLVAGAARSIAQIPSWHDDETHYQALLRDAPRSYRVLWLRGRDEFAAGRPASGERLFLAAIAFAPELTGPRYELAQNYMKARLWQPAIRQLEASVALDSSFTLGREALRIAQDSAGTR